MLKYLTADIPGTGGVIKETPEDFLVEEIPAYLPCGEGEHTYAVIEKRGVTTLEAIRRIARALDISDREIGYAGMKDAVGVTRQTISLPRVAPELCMGLALPGITVLSALRHRNKLKPGHLAGNRFSIRVNGVTAGALDSAGAVLDILRTRGVPNYFGVQRYGAQGNSHLVGRAFLRGEWRNAFDLVIGDPAAVRDEKWRMAIEAYRQGDIEGSARMMPAHCRTERDILQRLAKRPDAFEKSLYAIHPRLRKLYISACQSALFDRLLEQRLASFDRLMAGDLAFKHENGACFTVADAAAEAPRAQSLEISPTGPMFGFRMKLPEGEPGRMESVLLDSEGLVLESFNLLGGLAMEGERRPLRVPINESSAKMAENRLVVDFSLPRGAYATSVMREIMKPDER